MKNLVGTQAVPWPATRGGPVAAWGLTRRAPWMVIMVIMIYHGDHHHDHETTWWSAHPASHYIRKRAGWVRAERLKLINSVIVNMMIMIDIMTLTLLIWRGQYLYNWTGAETKSGTIAVSRFRRKSLVLIVIIVMIIIIIMNMGGGNLSRRGSRSMPLIMITLPLTLPSVLPCPLHVGSGLDTAVFLLCHHSH